MSGQVFALIPAAGHSRRMGQPKLALPLGGRTVLEWVISAFRQAGVEKILVVLGPHVRDLADLARAAGAEALVLPEPTPDMRATVEQGLAWLEQQYHPEPTDAWLLAPGDHPMLRPQVVREILRGWQEHPQAGIIIPTCGGRRGHPALIHWGHVAAIRALPPDKGLNVYFRQCQGVTLELPLEDPGVICDLDTPEDYERLCARMSDLPE